MSALIEAVECEPLSVPVVDPFVIASGRADATRSILVRVRLREGRESVIGFGEGSCLPPVTREDQPQALAAVLGVSLAGLRFESLDALERALDEALGATPVARAAVEMAVLDALARARGVPLFRLFEGAPAQAAPIETDITLPILTPARMAALAAQWAGQGFGAFKVKVGRGLDEDLEALDAIVGAVPTARLRVDANGGYSVSDALAFLEAVARRGLRLECFEQPCGSWEGLAELRRRSGGVPILADESVKRLADLQDLAACGGAHGVNLKVAKGGGLLEAHRIGVAAKRLGLKVMVGGMLETRLGMTAATHLAVALGQIDFADLDTAWLLREDPFVGGYRAAGAIYTLGEGAGLDVQPARR